MNVNELNLNTTGDRAALATHTIPTQRLLKEAAFSCSLEGLPKTIEKYAEDLNARHSERKDVLVTVNANNGSILVKAGIYGIEDKFDPADSRQLVTIPTLSIIGGTEEHEEYEEFISMVGRRVEPNDLAEWLKPRRRNFSDDEQRVTLIAKLSAFEAKVDTAIQKVRDERTGKIKDALSKEVRETNFGAFKMRFRFFKGGNYVVSEFFIGLYPQNEIVYVALMNNDLKAVREKLIEEQLNEVVGKVQTLLPNVPFLYV